MIFSVNFFPKRGYLLLSNGIYIRKDFKKDGIFSGVLSNPDPEQGNLNGPASKSENFSI